MESVGLEQNGDCIEDLSAEQLLSLGYSDACGVFGDPEVLARVGDQYQVDIPALIPKPDYVCYMKRPPDAVNKDHFYCNFLRGFLIPGLPAVCFNEDTEKMKDEKQEFSSDSTDAFNKNVPSEIESVRDTMPPYQGPEYCLFSGSSGDLWSDIEKASVLLGLYIFEKNFVQLKRFVESKKMGDILSFYYGVFYRSIEYNRWSKCRKIKSRKRVYGQRIFSGLRQHELLSRLLPQVSEECQKALLEISKTFGEGKMSLEEYVSSLKAMVGMNILVEAVGIGKGKQDLTGMAIEPVKSKQVTHMRPEIPIGKACSSLTPTEIVKFLTGDYRLSKARSNDLFWEAVWPRLLARGWHSEQPNNQTYVPGAKHSLVFLIPGVKKFSRRRLVKGNHYFDSVTDVLSKVGSEPGILELETEEDEGNKEEIGWTNEIREQEDLPERQRHCYLQPRTPSRNIDVTKFTVVGTSLANGKKFKFRELRTLPTEISEDGDQGTSEVSANESDCGYTMFVDKETKCILHTKTLSDGGIVFDRKDVDISSLDQGVRINCSDSTKPLKQDKKHNHLYNDKETGKDVKSRLSQKLKRKDLDCLASVTKQHRTLTACTNREMSSSMNSFPLNPIFGEEVPGCSSDSHSPHLNKALSQVGSSLDRLSSTISSKSSPPKSVGGALYDDYHGQEHSQNNPQPQTMIDLNLPQLLLDYENGVFMTDSTNRQDDLYAPKTSVETTNSELHANMNSRRQSTRNRPPTARALEALVNGYLTTNRKQKKEANAHEASTSRPPRKLELRWDGSELTTDNAVLARGDGTGVYDVANRDMFEKLQVLSNGNGTQISNP